MALIKKEHEIILKHFQEYGKISTYEARNIYGIAGLSKYINDIRLLGYNITEDWEQRENEPSDINFYKVYTIKQCKINLGRR